MFGEYGIYRNGKMAALVCDDLLYVQPTAAGLAFWEPRAASNRRRHIRGQTALSHQRGALGRRLLVERALRITSAELPLPKKK